MQKMLLGKADKDTGGWSVMLNLPSLIETRMLLTANSGAGKSWALRRILEQSYGHAQQIVLDVEDEFHTLREKYDYILAGPGGDCAVSVQSSALLARRLLEHRVSAIVNLYELKAHERATFVKRFLDAMIAAPKNLWHPVVVVVDEAHLWAPQTGSAESLSAVIDLMTRGRKRGYCGILATQRISKLHKDAAAEANNKLIGRSALDVDMKRAADELGFGKDKQAELRYLDAGEFFVFGPAIGDGKALHKIKVGGVKTQHPKIGADRAEPKPPSAKVKALLAKIGDLPAAVVAQAQTESDLRNQVQGLKGTIRNLERQLDATAKGGVSLVKDAATIKELRQRLADTEHKLTAQGMNNARLRKIVEKSATMLGSELKTLLDIVTASHDEAGKVEMAIVPKFVTPVSAVTIRAVPKKIAMLDDTADAGLRGGSLRMLLALAQGYPARFTEAQWGTMSDMAHTGGSFATYRSKLTTLGYIERGGDLWGATEEGVRAAGQEIEPMPPPGPDRVEFWANRLNGKPAMMLRNLLAGPMTKHDLAVSVDMAASGGSFATYLSKLTSNKLAMTARGSDEVQIAEWLIR